ncbi:MAG: succinyl-diaminopimelate desuccinylase [Pseudomonadota bacterium]
MNSPSPSDGHPRALEGLLARWVLDLCSVPSVTGSERDLCDLIAAWFRGSERAWSVTRAGDGLAVRGPARGLPLVTLVGHLDTVPPAAGGPYAGTEGARLPAWREGDVLHGLGAADMKSGLAVMLAVAQLLDPALLPWDLGLVFYPREEGPYEESGLPAVLAAAPWIAASRLAVLLEPSDNRIQLGCLGCLHAWARFHGRAAHSARPWQGENAVHKAAGLLAAVAALPERQVDSGGFVFRETLSITAVRGGGARNVVPGSFAMNLNFRFAPDRTLAEAEAWLRAFVAEHGGEVALDVDDKAPAAPARTDEPAVARYLAAMGAVVEPKLAWTDVARLAEAGIPAVNHGPGLSAQCHQAGEHTELGLIVEFTRRLLAFLEAPPA